MRGLLAPPYPYLPFAVFVFTVLCFVAHPNGAVRTGYLADTDDYMRLNQTINWLQGQGWHDVSHPRLSPGTHTVVHWARLLDLPLALLMLPLIPVMGMQNAALFAAFIVPPAMLGVLLWLAARLARIFVAEDRANLAALLVVFAPLTLLNFVPGRVDHHGYEVLVAGVALLALERIVVCERRGTVYAALAAVALACGLWIGTEALPWALLFVACLGGLAAWLGGEVARRAALFGLAFTATTLLVLPLAVPPSEYSSLALSWYSAADVVFAALSAVMLAGVWGLARAVKNPWVRCAGLLGLGMAAAILFCIVVPGVAGGPFADYDEFDATIALDSIGEAQPLIRQLHVSAYNVLQNTAAVLCFLQTLFLPLLGLMATGLAAWRAKAPRRMICVAYGAFLTSSILMTMFWQMRVGWFMQFFAVAPLTYLLLELWQAIGKRFSGRARFGMEALAFLSLGFLPVVLIPALANDAPVMTHIVMFPGTRGMMGCPMRSVASFLSLKDGYGAATHTIMASGNEGAELLFRTRHNVIAANFNVAGNVDAYNFFGARDDVMARNILKHWHADLVLMCRSFPTAYARLNHVQVGKTAFLTATPDGLLHLASDPEHPTLIERLVHGPVPAWLKPVEIPGDNDYVLFEVK